MNEVSPPILDPQVNRLASLLRDITCVAGLPHYSRSLVDHLIGTAQVLSRVGASTEVVRAGLVHSIYSTEHYPHAAVSIHDRERIRAYVGNRAERLAYLFCAIRKEVVWQALEKGTCEDVEVSDRFLMAVERITHQEARSLLQLECCNYIEQVSELDRSPRPFLSWYMELARQGRVSFRDERSLRAGLSEQDETSSISIYNEAVRNQDERMLAEAQAINSCAAEPHIASALLSASTGKWHQAYQSARAGRARLNGWGTPWDKRLSFAEWVSIADAVPSFRDPIAARAYVDRLWRKLEAAQ